MPDLSWAFSWKVLLASTRSPRAIIFSAKERRYGVNEFSGDFISAIHIHGADDGFKCIREDELSGAAGIFGFTLGKQKKIIHTAKLSSDFGKSDCVYECRTIRREIAFALRSVFAEEKIRDNELEHGIAEEFQAFVVFELTFLLSFINER